MWQDIKNIYHLFVAILANIFYGFPGRRLKVVGVTGTDGKTTTVHLIYHILKSSNKKVSMLSSIEALIDGKSHDTGFHVTTPSPFAIQRFLKKALNSGSEYFVLEVTSHALDQNRVWGIPFEIGVLTNITREHLDYHETYDEYLKTKTKLLLSSKIPIINKNDSSYKRVSETLTRSKKLFSTYETFRGSNFNEQNFQAGKTVCLKLGLSENELKKAIKTFKLPKGRLDFVYNSDFSVVIDFAHTPNAFEKVLSYLRKSVKGRLIHVFGAAGERDSKKRPEMGKISAKYSDLIILTSEDPRSEDPENINKQIKSGIKSPNKIQSILDREDAIRFAIKNAKKGDLILITGKAHEKSMNLGHGEEPWDEYKVVQEALK